MGSTSMFLYAIFTAVTLADHFFVKDDSRVCIIMDANITGKVFYTTVANETTNYVFNVTVVGSGGSCASVNATQRLDIKFLPNNMSEVNPWNLTLFFSNKMKTFVLDNYVLTADFSSSIFNATEEIQKYVKSEKAECDVNAEQANGFRCSETVLSLVEGSTVGLTNLRVIAFANLNNTVFPDEQTFEQCALDARTSEIVPIVVGACLAMLVIIVLIAYLIGRARAKRQGYASV